jgi:NitT/TauT family transport system ATP-binding protein
MMRQAGMQSMPGEVIERVASMPESEVAANALPKIDIRGVSKRFGRTQKLEVLRDIGLTVGSHEFLAIVGPSGCGKSTLLHMVAGFIPIEEGEITVAGHAVAGPGPDRGVVFQAAALLPWRTVRGNILLPLEERGLPRDIRNNEAEHLIEQVGLSGFENFYPKQLSGGMRQRVSIARTLALDPDVLLMDEPFAALDAQTRMLMQRDLLKLWSTQRKTVLFVTHDVREAVYLGERVAVMSTKPGRIKAVLDTSDLQKGRDFEEADEGFSRKCNEIWRLLREEITRE